MLNAIRSFFQERLNQPDDSGRLSADSLALASAALMFEVVRADRSIDEAERKRLRGLLRSEFDLAETDLDELELLAEREIEEATDLHQFTSLVNANYGQPERIALVEKLWAVAWADGAIDDLEEHTIRRVAGLLHVRHSDFIAARRRTRP